MLASNKQQTTIRFIPSVSINIWGGGVIATLASITGKSSLSSAATYQSLLE
ncbi:hypothetical protein XF_0443 [Xylella fastidiosa 9a5c]|uniref:Uncharacterized protein n=1 Tax=Xylella fastidiosa (strain 9a5c) TaxID=160492 RepID=Q9PG59_XYLFA|nr:hypothetical protein XF_0443 [Xylella fastidiosa 9a5c]